MPGLQRPQVAVSRPVAAAAVQGRITRGGRIRRNETRWPHFSKVLLQEGQRPDNCVPVCWPQHENAVCNTASVEIFDCCRHRHVTCSITHSVREWAPYETVCTFNTCKLPQFQFRQHLSCLPHPLPTIDICVPPKSAAAESSMEGTAPHATQDILRADSPFDVHRDGSDATTCRISTGSAHAQAKGDAAAAAADPRPVPVQQAAQLLGRRLKVGLEPAQYLFRLMSQQVFRECRRLARAHGRLAFCT